MSGLLLLVGVASAAELEVGGNLKVFHLSTYPYDNDFFAAEVQDGSAFAQPFPLEKDAVQASASSSGLLTSRLTFEVYGDQWSFELHPQLTIQPAAAGTGLTLAQTGTGIPEAVDLSWEAVDDDELLVQLRADRLAFKFEQGPVGATVGRQAITFGRGFFFTPLDLVNPFFPTSVDQEYKPGVDAARVDAYYGTGGQATVASAYRGDWDLDGMVHAVYAQQTLGLWDIGLFGGLVQGDTVGGISLAGSIGPVSLHTDTSVTEPRQDDEDLFVRSVVGAQGSVTPTTQLIGEVYVQTNGATDPSDYLDQYDSPRYRRSELWLAGRTYSAVSITQEVRPTLSGMLVLIANLEDPSALAGPSLIWSVSDNVTGNLGAYIGLGERPPDYQIERFDTPIDAGTRALEIAEDPFRSELGTTPTTVFASMQAWF
ncbi:MAG TPA: hypothetical protein DFR83_03175 [Deltaproteobacteria bacterium]|nr:hypothetical protein [Deltaproteobacteria bacterium]